MNQQQQQQEWPQPAWRPKQEQQAGGAAQGQQPYWQAQQAHAAQGSSAQWAAADSASSAAPPPPLDLGLWMSTAQTLSEGSGAAGGTAASSQRPPGQARSRVPRCPHTVCPGIYTACGAQLRWIEPSSRSKGFWGCCRYPECNFNYYPHDQLEHPALSLEVVTVVAPAAEHDGGSSMAAAAAAAAASGPPTEAGASGSGAGVAQQQLLQPQAPPQEQLLLKVAAAPGAEDAVWHAGGVALVMATAGVNLQLALPYEDPQAAAARAAALCAANEDDVVLFPLERYEEVEAVLLRWGWGKRVTRGCARCLLFAALGRPGCCTQRALCPLMIVVLPASQTRSLWAGCGGKKP